MNNPKICVVGAGSWGQNHIRTLQILNALGGIVERSKSIRQELKKQYSDCGYFESVQDALHNLMKYRTTFVIAHRLSTIKHAHSIVVLNKGEIVEIGTHEKLLTDCKLYQKYYAMQILGSNGVDDIK